MCAYVYCYYHRTAIILVKILLAKALYVCIISSRKMIFKFGTEMPARSQISFTLGVGVSCRADKAFFMPRRE